MLPPPGQSRQAVRTVGPRLPLRQIHYFWDFLTMGSPVSSPVMYLPKVNPLIRADPSDFSEISIYESDILSKLNILRGM